MVYTFVYDINYKYFSKFVIHLTHGIFVVQEIFNFYVNKLISFLLYRFWILNHY